MPALSTWPVPRRLQQQPQLDEQAGAQAQVQREVAQGPTSSPSCPGAKGLARQIRWCLAFLGHVVEQIVALDCKALEGTVVGQSLNQGFVEDVVK